MPYTATSQVPFAFGSDTSRAAAESIGDPGSLRARVFQAIADGGALGRTCDEVELALGMAHQTASARVNELVRRGALIDGGLRRPTRSGRMAVAWLARTAR